MNEIKIIKSHQNPQWLNPLVCIKTLLLNFLIDFIIFTVDLEIAYNKI